MDNNILIFLPVDDIIINDYTGCDTWVNRYKHPPFTELRFSKFTSGGRNYINRGTAINKHKWPTVVDIITEYRDIIQKYDYVYLIDNDVRIDNQTLTAFINKVTSLNLEIAQMAVHRTNGTHAHLLHRGRKGVVRVKFCEVMAPIIRTDILLEMYDKGYLSESESGWGIDYIWGKFYENWLVQDCVMYHTKKVSSTQWVMSDGRTPMMELEAIKRKYKIR